jgi:hypothetical protein
MCDSIQSRTKSLPDRKRIAVRIETRPPGNPEIAMTETGTTTPGVVKIERKGGETATQPTMTNTVGTGTGTGTEIENENATATETETTRATDRTTTIGTAVMTGDARDLRRRIPGARLSAWWALAVLPPACWESWPRPPWEVDDVETII